MATAEKNRRRRGTKPPRRTVEEPEEDDEETIEDADDKEEDEEEAPPAKATRKFGKAKDTAKKKTDPDWSQVLDSLASGGDSRFIFPKAGRTRVRLVRPDPDEPYFIEVETKYRGKPRKRFLVLAIRLDDEEGDQSVRGLLLSKTAFRNIVTLITEDYELWDEEDGHGLNIMRSGQGTDTTYTILPSKKPIAIELPDEAPTLEELKAVYEEMQDQRGDDDEEDEAPQSKGGNKKSGRRQSRSVSEDERSDW